MPYMRNKRTGEMVEVDESGQPVSRNQGPPMDPRFPYMGPQAGANLQQTGAQTTNTQANTNRTRVQTQGDVLANTKTARDLHQNPIGDRDQALINGMRQNQGDLAAVLRDITGAQQAVDRFQPSPGKGSDYSWGVPEDDDWPITAAAKNAYASMRGMSQQQREAFQTLRGLQNQSVLNAQIPQKGPQTEADAIRMKLAGVSPNKDVRPNAQLLAEQQYDTVMKMKRPGFYESWANYHGSTHALNGEGKSADDVWNEQYVNGLQKMRSDPRYSGRKQPLGARRPPPRRGVIDFNDLGN